MSRLACLTVLLTLTGAAAGQQPLPDAASSPTPSWVTRTINGSVARQGASAGNVRITIESSSGSFRRTVYSDSSGNFFISGVPAGEYTFLLESEGYQPQRESVLVTPGTGTIMLQFLMRIAPLKAPRSSSEPVVSVQSLQVPPAAREEWEAARRELERKRWKQARAHLEKALQEYAEFPQALRLLAILDLGEQRPEQAVTHLHRAVEIDPAYAEGYTTLSRVLNFVGKCEQALGAALRAVELRPDWWQGHYERGVAALCLNRDEEAFTASERLLALGGRELAETHLLRAGVFLKREQLTEAKAELEVFLKLAPKHEQAPLAERTLKTINDQLSPPGP